MPKLRANLRLSDAVERYLERLKNSGQAERSRYTAYYVLLRFQKSFYDTRDKDPYVHTITPDTMDGYCYGEKGIRRDVGSSAFNRYRSVLNSFFEYALQMRWCDTNPMDAIDRARPDAPKSRLMLNAGELMALLDNCHNPIARVACSIGMNTGLRANDIRNLTIFDTSLAAGTIQTEIRKTRKLDTKPITMELHWELKRWFNAYAELMGLAGPEDLPNEWLVCPSYHYYTTRTGMVVTVPKPTEVHRSPWRMVQVPLERMGYPTKGEGFHTLRRSSARALFESLRSADYGRDHALMVVKEFLNHSSTAQTEHYLGLNQERVIRDVILKDQPFLSALVQQEQRRVQHG